MRQAQYTQFQRHTNEFSSRSLTLRAWGFVLAYNFHKFPSAFQHQSEKNYHAERCQFKHLNEGAKTML